MLTRTLTLTSVCIFFCGVRSLLGNCMGPWGAKALTEALFINCSFTECDLKYNDIGKEGETSVRNAVQGKAGFKLHL